MTATRFYFDSRSAHPPEAWDCPDCDFAAPLFVTVAQHMQDAHGDDHPGEIPWYDYRTYVPCWEDEDVLDQ